jgi:hypothetical protein
MSLDFDVRQRRLVRATELKAAAAALALAAGVGRVVRASCTGV